MKADASEVAAMNTKNSDLIVMVNGISVGGITSEQMTQIDTAVKQDKRLWIAQGVEVMRCAVRVVTNAIKYTPFTLFAWALMGTMQDPDGFNKIIANGPSEYFLTGAYFSFFIACIALIVEGLVTGKLFGFNNKFSERKAWLIRERLNVPAEGTVSCFKRP
ncbi:hypothetical protein [Pseudomonas savastanoi]|nr:hypothetical protein [Pseudomonas savastanoi]